MRLGVRVLSVRFSFLGLKMGALRLEFGKYKIFLVARVRRLLTSFYDSPIL